VCSPTKIVEAIYITSVNTRSPGMSLFSSYPGVTDMQNNLGTMSSQQDG